MDSAFQRLAEVRATATATATHSQPALTRSRRAHWQIVGDKGLVAALDALAPRGPAEEEHEQASLAALRTRLQESELRCVQLEERCHALETENNQIRGVDNPPPPPLPPPSPAVVGGAAQELVAVDQGGDGEEGHLVPTELVRKLIEEYDSGRTCAPTTCLCLAFCCCGGTDALTCVRRGAQAAGAEERAGGPAAGGGDAAGRGG